VQDNLHSSPLRISSVGVGMWLYWWGVTEFEGLPGWVRRFYLERLGAEVIEKMRVLRKSIKKSIRRLAHLEKLWT